jgi:hypothetical protein
MCRCQHYRYLISTLSNGVASRSLGLAKIRVYESRFERFN